MNAKASAGLLPEADTARLIKLAQAGDSAAKEKLVEANLRLIYSIAGRFVYMGRELEDLFQVGAIGLLKAIEKFDFSYGVCFSTYAVPLIMGEIRRYLRDDAPLSVSRSLRERALAVQRKREELCRLLGREPQLLQLAESLNLTTEQVLTALDVNKPVLSLSEPVYQRDGDEVALGATLAADDGEGGEGLINGIAVRQLLEALPPRLSYILRCRYFEDKTQAQIAAQLGISQVQVSRLEKQALTTLRERLAEPEHK